MFGAIEMSNNNLISTVSHTVFGTAVAGFGFSLGRDVYKKFKELSHIILLLIFAFSTFAFPFLSASKTFRWYPITKIRWFFSKFLLWMLVCLLGLLVSILLLMALQGLEFFTSSANLLKLEVTRDQANIINSSIFVSFFYLLGVVDGLRRRTKRKQVYQIEVDNSQFLDDIGIYETDGSNSFTHVDEEGNWLRLENIGRDLVEFFVVGKRNKRSYIYIDSSGRFSEYSGVISL